MTEQEIFLAALDKDSVERAAFLDAACAGNETLRRGVETLLRIHAAPHRFLEVPVVEQLAAAQAEPENVATDLSFLAPSSEPGSLGRLDHYEILEVVGRGGTGVVLRAHDTKLLRIVALKVLAATLAASGTARQRFAREARAAAAVRDEHVIDIYAVRDDALVPYLVMEYIEGQNLETLLRKGGPLEVKEILRIGTQIASGLAAAHRQGLIHRDVKPANILLENGVQRVKLTDFGLARAADDATLTQTGFIAGTPLYMAPEQAAGEPIDARTDLFSLGSVLYELCTGRPAFRAPTTLAVMKRVSEETPRPIRVINPDIPESVCRLIERLHAKKAAERPASAVEVADLLAELLADRNGGRSREPSGTVRHRGPARLAGPTRRRWLWAAAALLVLLGGLGLGEATGVTDVRGTVIRLLSSEGTLVVEVDDPRVSVTVDGGDVVITGAGAKEIRLKPGQYQVEASRDGKVVRQELVTVARNGRQVVRISKEAPPLTEAEQWEKSVAALPAAEQVKAFARRLQQLNPGFDGKVTPWIVDGVVVGVSFLTDDVADISPVRVFRRLERLDCPGTCPGKGKLSDLTPLRGMRLNTLNATCTLVSDLSPLRDMHLAFLYLGDTRVSDLSPLRGSRLGWLGLQNTGVRDLSPLRGMPLITLDLHGASRVSDLSPLDSMRLEYLNLTGLPVSDISVVGSLKSLGWLNVTSTPVSDLTPLRGLSLKILAIPNTRVKDLTPIKRLPLTELHLTYRPEDKEVLRSLKGLKTINNKPVAEFWKEVDGK